MVVFTWLVFFVLVEIDQRLLGGDPWGLRRRPLDFESTRSVVLVLVLAFVYEVVPTAAWGATPGKAMFGLRLRLVTRAVPAWLVALARAVLLYVPLLFLGVYSAIMMIVLLVSVASPANGRGLHDRLVGTFVVAITAPDQDE